MKYLLLGDDYKVLFIEDDKQQYSIRYDKNDCRWVQGGTALWDNRVGFDESEPEDSIYRYGNSSCMKEIREITKEEAEAFISKDIVEEEVIATFRSLFKFYN